MTLADQLARERIASDFDATLVVEAAAGTGKTTALVGRIVAIVAAGHRGATLARLISVTFTEKAAGEMRLRLRGALEDARARAAPPSLEHRRLEQALAELEVARIGTIHALCADLLREHPLEAGVDPLFEVATEPEAQALLDTAFDRWFPDCLRAPPEGIRRLLRRKVRHRDAVPPREQLRRAAWQLVDHRDFDGPWRRDPFDREAELDALLPALQELAALARRGDPEDFLCKNLLDVSRFLEDLAHHEGAAGRDHDGLEAALYDLDRARSWSWTGGKRAFAQGLPRDQVLQARDAVKRKLERVLERSASDLAACLHEELLPLVALYGEVKARSGKLDFFDLLFRVRALLQSNPRVRRALQERFTHLFIDEFQDTDPLQADILRLLAAEAPEATDPERAAVVPGKLFLVGDPKQSIYRFRRADVALYEHVKRGLLSQGAALLDLTTSFRSAPDIQRVVNAAFGLRMGEGSQTQARYVPLDRFRAPLEGQPSVVALPVPRPYGLYGSITSYQIEESYPDAVGAFIEFLVRKSGWRVEEPGQGLVPLEARHVCILFKRFRGGPGGDVTARYTAALEARRLPHVLVGGRSFHTREEILAARNALCAIEWPDDELCVYATLRGPFFALSDDALLAFRGTTGSLHPLKHVGPGELSTSLKEVAEALALIGQLHRGRNRRPIADTLSLLLEATRAHAALAFWSAGDQALANLSQLADLGRRFEAMGGRSFRGFVQQLEDQAEAGEAPEAPIVEEGSEGVRMMTVHAAKGLEFPVVILAEPTAPSRREKPSHYVDPARRLWAEPLAWCDPVELLEHRDEVLRRDEEEAVRLAYVAATRARDLLVVPVVGDERRPGWVEVLHPAVYPSPASLESPASAPGCPVFARESVLDRPDKAWGKTSVPPGLHRAELGEQGVVWWDPSALELNKAHHAGLHQDELLREDEGGVRASAGLSEHQAWWQRRLEALEQGARPTMKVATAQDLRDGGSVAVRVERTDAARDGRPRGRRFGALVHAALEKVRFQAEADERERVVRLAGRGLGSSEPELTFALAALEAALRHPLMKRAAASPRLFREMPVGLAEDDGLLVEGVVDLAFLESGAWQVVDFKTDVELDGALEAYRAQVGLYVRAISRATGLPAHGVLLSV